MTDFKNIFKNESDLSAIAGGILTIAALIAATCLAGKVEEIISELTGDNNPKLPFEIKFNKED